MAALPDSGQRLLGALGSARAAFGSSRWPRLWLVPLLLVIELVYVFYCSAGTFTRWPEYNRYYDLLADGFRNGQLHLPIAPSPELLAQQDPYDYRHVRLWLWDISLYDGKYYLYWGPVPALFQAIGKTLLGIDRSIGDQYLVFFFSSVSALFGALLIEKIARHHFAAVPRWLVGVAILSFAFANPVVYLVATAGVYQTAITGGQTFLLGGFLFAYSAVTTEQQAAGRKRRLLLCGAAFGLALGCRISLAPCIGLMLLATLLVGLRREDGWVRRSIVDALYLGLPVVAAGGLLLVYNYARFGEWLEFGVNYQLSTLEFRMSRSYWAANLYAYMLAPYEVTCRFPYLLQNWYEGPKGLPAWFKTPDGYLVQEPTAGWLVTAPITWLSPVPVVALLASVRRRGPSVPRTYLFCVACCLFLGSVTGVAVMGLYGTTMRYLGDVTYGLVLLGVLGGFTLLSLPRLLPLRKPLSAAFTLLAASTLLIGLLLGEQGYIQHFKRGNPALHARLEKTLSVCPEPAPAPPVDKRVKRKHKQRKAPR